MNQPHPNLLSSNSAIDLGVHKNDALCFQSVKSVVDIESHVLIEQVFAHYHQAYSQNPSIKAFVQISGRIPCELKQSKYIGLCSRTLGRYIPKANTVLGGTTRGILKQLGLFTATGGEYFRGCIVFPNRSIEGQIISAVGIRYGERIRRYEKTRIEWQLLPPGQRRLKVLNRAREVYHV
jgi:hypothetical protein